MGKKRPEFDAEAMRTLAYGFVAAALFGDFTWPLRIVYLASGVASYVIARSMVDKD